MSKKNYTHVAIQIQALWRKPEILKPSLKGYLATIKSLKL